MKDIDQLNDSFLPCSRVYIMPDTFEKLPKLMEVLYPLVENKEIKLYKNHNLLFDKTLMVDDNDLPHFRDVCNYRIEDCGGAEYSLNLQENMFPIIDNYPNKLLSSCQDGQEFFAMGYAENTMSLTAKFVITDISHESQRETLELLLPKFGISSTIFNFAGLVNSNKLYLSYFSPRIKNFIQTHDVNFCTGAIRNMIRKSF